MPTKRVTGILNGKFTIKKNFRDQDTPKFKKDLRKMWKLYRTGQFTQAEIATKFRYTLAKAAMMLRCDPQAPKRASRTMNQRFAELRSFLKAEAKRQEEMLKAHKTQRRQNVPRVNNLRLIVGN